MNLQEMKIEEINMVTFAIPIKMIFLIHPRIKRQLAIILILRCGYGIHREGCGCGCGFCSLPIDGRFFILYGFPAIEYSHHFRQGENKYLETGSRDRL